MVCAVRRAWGSCLSRRPSEVFSSEENEVGGAECDVVFRVELDEKEEREADEPLRVGLGGYCSWRERNRAACEKSTLR